MVIDEKLMPTSDNEFFLILVQTRSVNVTEFLLVNVQSLFWTIAYVQSAGYRKKKKVQTLDSNII